MSGLEVGVAIVARHIGLVEWLYNKGIKGEVITHVTSPEQIKGKDVYGILPLHLAAWCNSITEVSMPNLPAEMRGKELTPKQMDEYGAHLNKYVVQRLN